MQIMKVSEAISKGIEMSMPGFNMLVEHTGMAAASDPPIKENFCACILGCAYLGYGVNPSALCGRVCTLEPTAKEWKASGIGIEQAEQIGAAIERASDAYRDARSGHSLWGKQHDLMGDNDKRIATREEMLAALVELGQ